MVLGPGDGEGKGDEEMGDTNEVPVDVVTLGEVALPAGGVTAVKLVTTSLVSVTLAVT